MSDVLKTWTHIFVGLVLAVLFAIFLVGLVATKHLVESKTIEIKVRDRKAVSSTDCESKATSKRESCWSETDRDPVTMKLPDICIPNRDCVRNQCSKKDGCGMICLACIETAARYQDIRPLYGLLERERNNPGGHYPEKIENILTREQKRGAFGFCQYEGKDFDEYIQAALNTGHIPCVSYSGKGHGSFTMVCVLHLDPASEDEKVIRERAEKSGEGFCLFTSKQHARRACILDPNFPDKREWLSRSEFLKNAACNGDGTAWVVTLQK